MNFQWGRTAGCIRIDGPNIFADAGGKTRVGAALSMQACVNGSCSWTLGRISSGGIASDYLGVCIDTRFSYPSAPASSAFNGFVVGFRSSAKSGGELRYKSGIDRLPNGLPTLEEEGSTLEEEGSTHGG